MPSVNSSIGEVRIAPNGNSYAYISVQRTKGRVALLLIKTKSVQSVENSIITIDLKAWRNWPKVSGEDHSGKITDAVRFAAYNLLHELPDKKYQK